MSESDPFRDSSCPRWEQNEGRILFRVDNRWLKNFAPAFFYYVLKFDVICFRFTKKNKGGFDCMVQFFKILDDFFCSKP